MLNGATCLAQDETGQRDVVPFMRIKLAHTKEIVEGLALNDFESIVRSTQKLNLMSLESSWNVYESTEYTELSKTFRESVDRLRKAAVRKSSDGAMLAYFEVTLNCVRCHQYLRDRHPKPDSPRE
jgi:hypothetical protein